MVRLLLLISVFALGTWAASAEPEVVQERNALMKSNWREGLSPLLRMVRGRDKYDQAKVDAAFAKMGEIAAKLPPLWPPDSQVSEPKTDYFSSPKVWENKSDFDQRLVKFADAVKSGAPKAKNLDGLKVAYQSVNATCEGCHEIYQLKRR
jgi:cytochrome c556